MSIENLAGIKSLDTLIEFLTDPTKVKGALDSMRAEQKKLDDKIELYGKAKEIGKLLTAAKIKDQQSGEILDGARKEAAGIVDEAIEARDKGQAEIQQRLDDAERKQAIIDGELKKRRKDVEAHENKYTKSLDELEQRERACAEKERLLEVQRVSLQNRVDRINQAVE